MREHHSVIYEADFESLKSRDRISAIAVTTARIAYWSIRIRSEVDIMEFVRKAIDVTIHYRKVHAFIPEGSKLVYLQYGKFERSLFLYFMSLGRAHFFEGSKLYWYLHPLFTRMYFIA